MGREINRVPLDFDWPIGQTWLAYEVTVQFPECPTCRVTDDSCSVCRHRTTYSDGYSAPARAIKKGLRDGSVPWPPDVERHSDYKAVEMVAASRGVEVECPRCHGHADLATDELRAWAETMPETPLPSGDGWQLWETVGDSPMSPVFATDAELVEWMVVNPWMLNSSLYGPSLVPSDRTTAEKFVAAGWAPSMMTIGNVLFDGVTAVVNA